MASTKINNTSSNQGSLFGKSNHYKHNQIRKYLTVFGSLFTDLYITREANGKLDYILVPIKYGSGYLYEKAEQGEAVDNKKSGLVLPSMSFYFESITPDESRNVNRHTPYNSDTLDNQDNANFVIGRKPYNITVRLDVRTKTVDEMLNITEQIIANCHPMFKVRVEDMQAINAEQDIAITLDDISPEDSYQDYTEQRIIQNSFQFTIKGYLYGKTYKAPIIKDFTLYASLASPTIETTTTTDNEIVTETYTERFVIAKGKTYDNSSQLVKDNFNDMLNSLSGYAAVDTINDTVKPRHIRKPKKENLK